MSRPAIPPSWDKACPVLHGPAAHEFIRGWGWLFLGLSLLLHLALLLALPGPADSPDAMTDMIIVRLPPPPEVHVPSPPPPAAAPPVKPAPEPANVPLAAQPAAQPPGEAAPTQARETSPIAAETGTGPAVAGDGGSGPAQAPDVPASPPGKGTGQPGNPLTPPPSQPPPPPPPEPPPPPREPEVDVKALLSTYAAGVKSAILRHKSYPQLAERLGHEGAVKVSFSIGADGELQSVSVRDSSGYDELDEAALDAVREAAPFDPLPEAAQRDELALSLTLKFNLN